MDAKHAINNSKNASISSHHLLQLSDFAKSSSYARSSEKHRHCKRRTTTQRRRRERRENEEQQSNENNKEDNDDDDSSVVIKEQSHQCYVDVNIICQLPTLPRPTNQEQHHQCYNDEYASVYTSDIELLHSLQVFDGDICFLSRNNHDDRKDKEPSNITNSYPVILRLIPSSSLSSTSTCSGSPVDNDSNVNSFQIYIPPNIAMTLGVQSNIQNSSTTTSYINTDIYLHCPKVNCNLSTCTSINTTNDHNNKEEPIVHHATKAQLIEIATPPNDHLVTFEKLMLSTPTNYDHTTTRISSAMIEEQIKKAQDDALKEYFYTTSIQSCSIAIKNSNDGSDELDIKTGEKNRLVRNGSIIVTLAKNPVTLHDNQFHDDDRCNDDDTSSIIRYYKVIHLEGNINNDNDNNIITTKWQKDTANHSYSCYWLSPKTELTLLQMNEYLGRSNNDSNQLFPIHDYPIHRIPRSSVMKSFISSVKKKSNNQQQQNNCDAEQKIESSPSSSSSSSSSSSILQSMSGQLSQRIFSIWNNRIVDQYGSIPVLTSQVLHVIGDNEIEVTSCIDEVAEEVGMNVIHIHGLSAFLFRQRMYTSSNDKKKNNNINLNITGTIIDKINGVKVACEIARKTSPCLLHICLNRELVTYDNDDASFDEENRLLSIMKEQLMESMQHVIIVDDIPPLFLILSTSKNLPRDGPIASNLMNDSFVMEVTTKEGNQSVQNSKSALIPNVKWEDVGGLSHVREEIMDTIELPLKYPHLFGKSKRSGILLYGPPGTGKTLIAKAVATECGLPFISVKGPELLGSYVGESEGNIRSTFESARKAALEGNGAILFFDEIDSLAPRRGGLGDGGGVMERVVASFLGEMDKDLLPSEDGLPNDRTKKVPSLFVIGATNRPDLLDPSLLRPGRFDRLVYLGVTTKREDRISILASLIRKFTFENDVSSHTMAESVIDHIPVKLTGADFSAISNKALMLALKRLCNQADNEMNKLMNDPNCTEKPRMEKILSKWSRDQCTPRVSCNDFISAAQGIVPIIKDEDLKRYEALKEQFSR